jgi:hypothetical protein
MQRKIRSQGHGKGAALLPVIPTSGFSEVFCAFYSSLHPVDGMIGILAQLPRFLPDAQIQNVEQRPLEHHFTNQIKQKSFSNTAFLSSGCFLIEQQGFFTYLKYSCVWC